MGAVTQFKAIETFSKTANATDAASNYIEFDTPYVFTGIIARVRNAAGALNEAALTVTQPTGKIRVAVTDLALNDVVSVIGFK